MSIDYTQAHRVTPGMHLKATGVRSLMFHTHNELYEVVRVEEGIFTSGPYVHIRNDVGSVSVLHLNRFSFPGDSDEL